MKLWLLLAGAFLVQEPISTGAVLLDAYQLHYNVWLIHLLFVVATLLDIVISYYLGIYLDRKYGRDKLVSWIKNKLEKFSEFVGKHGKVVALVVYAPIIFPFSGIFVPWLDMSLTDGLVYIFIGEVIFWYLPEWLLVLGVKSFVTNPYAAVVAVIIVTVLLVVIPGYFSKRKSRGSDANKK